MLQSPIPHDRDYKTSGQVTSVYWLQTVSCGHAVQNHQAHKNRVRLKTKAFHFPYQKGGKNGTSPQTLLVKATHSILIQSNSDFGLYIDLDTAPSQFELFVWKYSVNDFDWKIWKCPRERDTRWIITGSGFS